VDEAEKDSTGSLEPLVVGGDEVNKLYKLKSWFSIGEAANRLGAAIGEQVSGKDMLNLVLEGHIRLCWFTRHIPARPVALSSMICGKGYTSSILEGMSSVLPGFDEKFFSEQLWGIERWGCTSHSRCQ
jgi:hypothetical protein